MPHELDDLERVLVDLNKASKFVDGNNYEFYISFSVSDYLFDWENSKVDKQFFIDRFNISHHSVIYGDWISFFG